MDTKGMKLTQVVDIGNSVICDNCGKDCTHSRRSGGFLFGSTAYCPFCFEEGLLNIKRFNEESYIKLWCPPGVEFRKWILLLRGGDNTIKIYEI